MKRFRLSKNTIAGCITALLFAALLAFVGCAGWTQQQKDDAKAKVGQVALEIGECALEGPASTALETYLANRMVSDPGTIRTQIESALLGGIGHDIVCALKALGLRGSQASGVGGDMTTVGMGAVGVPDGGAMGGAPDGGVSMVDGGPSLMDGGGRRSPKDVLKSRAASCQNGNCTKEELLAAWLLLELEKSGRLKL